MVRHRHRRRCRRNRSRTPVIIPSSKPVNGAIRAIIVCKLFCSGNCQSFVKMAVALENKVWVENERKFLTAMFGGRSMIGVMPRY